MSAVSLTPMAGAQGEFAGVAMIRAWHDARGDDGREEILVPTAAHGTNPATAVMCGYRVREVAVAADGDMDMEALKAALGDNTAGIMLTNPSTCGVFERRIREIADAVHAAGGLLYYDGANLNAILGNVRPGDMGFDVAAPEPAQDLRDPPRRRRTRRRSRRRRRTTRAAPPDAFCLPGSARATAGSNATRSRDRSVACRRSWATPASCCAPWPTPGCSAAKACAGSANTRR